MRRWVAVFVVSCLAVGIFAGAEWGLSARRNSREASHVDRFGGEPRVDLLGSVGVFPATPEPVPEFVAWVAAGSGADLQQLLRGATRADDAMAVTTFLPSEQSAVDPATRLCSTAVAFMAAHPELGLRSVGVFGAQNGELVRGDVERRCEIAPYLRLHL